jgi:dethiobiotin synthetase
MIHGAFITSTGTSAGKTFLTRGIARALKRRGRSVLAVKPLETGVDPHPFDALAIARACARPEAAHAAGLVRFPLPVAPYAAALELGMAAPEVADLVAAIRSLHRDGELLLVEGAGGLLVPINARDTIADLARALAIPLLIVAPDRLGVLSDTLTCVESARARALHVSAIVLTQHARADGDPSSRTNRRILAERLECPVLAFPTCADDDDALADAADASEVTGLVEAFAQQA